LVQVTTLGQPLEVLKTQMAANRSQTMLQAVSFNQRGVLLFTAAEVESRAMKFGLSPASAGLVGGMSGGIVQAYATMDCGDHPPQTGRCRDKTPSTWVVFADIYRREGIAGINKGVNAVALRQMTNWGSRIGFARLAETSIRKIRGKGENDKLGAADKILASTIGGALGTWNQPIEVVRVEMQSMSKDAVASANRPAKLTVFNTLAFIYKENGIKGLYRGVTPRIGLGIWQTVCMVSFADYVKAW
ncbi:Mitochondrial carrier, partial [Rhizoctonia solani]